MLAQVDPEATIPSYSLFSTCKVMETQQNITLKLALHALYKNSL
jgi:hypothetical protein